MAEVRRTNRERSEAFLRTFSEVLFKGVSRPVIQAAAAFVRERTEKVRHRFKRIARTAHRQRRA